MEYDPGRYEWLSHILLYTGFGLLTASVSLLGWGLCRKGRRRRLAILGSILCFVVFASVAASNRAVSRSLMHSRRQSELENSPGTRTRVGKAAPDFSLTTVDGQHLSLSELRGNFVLLNFFATWCGPCKQELPFMQRIWDDFGESEGFTMIVVGRKESAELVAMFRSQQGYTFPVAPDPDGSVFNQFARDSIPRTYLISPHGIILYQSTGFYEQEIARLRRLIQKELDL